nr:hypothetical protein REQ54_01063 [Rhizobium sp. Q54]
MTTRQPTPGVHENFASISEPRLGLDHGDELVAGHPARFRQTEPGNESNKPDLAAELDGEVCSLEHDQSPFAEQENTDDRTDLLTEVTVAGRTSPPPPRSQMEGKEPPLDWSNFEGPKLNIEWKPDDQDLIYTAINFRDDEYGDKDDDAGQQIVERLLAAWKSTAISEQITFENAVRLLKERDELRAGIKRLSDEEELCDETTGDDPFSIVRLAAKLAAAEEARAEQWRLRRDAEASRDAMRAAADSLLQDRKALIEAIQPLLGCADFARENDLSGHETLIVTANEAREAATVVERINAEEEDQS